MKKNYFKKFIEILKDIFKAIFFKMTVDDYKALFGFKQSEKKFKFHNAVITIEPLEMRGHYVIRGMGKSCCITDSNIWKNCLNKEKARSCMRARRDAYQILKRKDS